MKISVSIGEFIHTYDSSVKDKVEGGFVVEYFPPVEEAVDAALTLLWNVYSKGSVARAIRDGVPAMDYCDEQ